MKINIDGLLLKTRSELLKCLLSDERLASEEVAEKLLSSYVDLVTLQSINNARDNEGAGQYQASLNYRKIRYVSFQGNNRGYNVQENFHQDLDDVIENGCTLRDLEEQGVKALTKLLDADPPYCETVSDRKPATPSHTVKVKWENSIVKEREERKNIERGIKRRTNEET